MNNNISFSFYPLQSTNEILLYTPRTSTQVSASANIPLITDFMSGLQLENTSKTVEIGGNIYHAELLAEFITSENILGDPINNLVFNLENLKLLWNVCKNNNQIVDSILDYSLKQIIENFKNSNILPLYAKSKSIKYFENQILTCTIKMLAFCELEDDLDDREKEQQEMIAANLWTSILYSFCCLIRLSPLIAVKSGTKLIKSFAEAIKYLKDSFETDNEISQEEKINYNYKKLLAICGCIKKLVEQINAGVLSGNVKDTILNINKNLKIKINFYY